MLITATTFLTVVVVALGFLGLGYWQKNVLTYGVGCFLLIVLGSFMWIQGFAEPVGHVVAYNVSGNITTGETSTTTYEQNTGWWTDGLGIVLGLTGFGLLAMMITEMREEKRKKESSLELRE